MAISDRLRLGPGPSNPYPEATSAFTRPMLGHLDPEFLALLDDTMQRLRIVFGTENALTFPVSGTGSAGMEACFVNLLEPGDTAIVGVNGVWGERMCEVARRCGAEIVRVEAPWGRSLDPDLLLAAQRAHPTARLVAVVHAETSTGVENEIAPLGALQDTDTLLVVDAVTSLAGIPLEVDRWGIDACYSGTQKCLGVAPALSPITFSERARDPGGSASWATRPGTAMSPRCSARSETSSKDSGPGSTPRPDAASCRGSSAAPRSTRGCRREPGGSPASPGAACTPPGTSGGTAPSTTTRRCSGSAGTRRALGADGRGTGGPPQSRSPPPAPSPASGCVAGSDP